MNEPFIKSNLTNIPEYPDRYTIEFRDLLIDYFGYIFPKPIIKKEKGLMYEVEFNIVDNEGSINEEEVEKLKPQLKINNKFDVISINKMESNLENAYSIKFTELLEEHLSTLKADISNPNSRQAYNIIDSIEGSWFTQGNIIIIDGFPLLKYWGIKTKYLPETNKLDDHSFGLFKNLFKKKWS